MSNTDVVRVLAVSPFEDDHSSLGQIFRRSRWIIDTCHSFREACAVLQQNSVPVVLCDESLPDGSWRDLLERASQSDNPPPVIVTSRLADDRLWSEVLSLGGYDLLCKPFRQSEVFRDVTLAFLHWKNHRKEPVATERAKTA